MKNFPLLLLLFYLLQLISSQQCKRNILPLYQKTKPSHVDFSLRMSSSQRNLLYYLHFLTTEELSGQWHRSDNFDHDTVKPPHKGYSAIAPNSNSGDTTLKLCLYGNTNKEEAALCLTVFDFSSLFLSSNFDDIQMIARIDNALVVTKHIKEFQTQQTCHTKMTISFRNKVNNKPFHPTYRFENDRQNIAIEIKADNLNCISPVKLRVVFPKYDMKLEQILKYFVDLALVCFTAQVLAAHWVNDSITSTFRQISLGKLIIIHAFDIYIAYQYLVGYIHLLTPIRSIPSPSIMMIIAYMSSILHSIAQHQKRITQEGYEYIIGLNYFVWFILSAILVVTSVVMKEHKLILLFTCLHEVPQILQNYIMESKQLWNFTIMIFITLPKLLCIAWTLTFSDIILGYNCENEIKVCLLLLVLQYIILFIQRKRPRIFTLPKEEYRFLTDNDRQENTEEEVCSICLEDNLQGVKSGEVSNSKQVSKVVTPCNHLYHITCLTHWMKENQTCPYCRSFLPPFIE